MFKIFDFDSLKKIYTYLHRSNIISCANPVFMTNFQFESAKVTKRLWFFCDKDKNDCQIDI